MTKNIVNIHKMKIYQIFQDIDEKLFQFIFSAESITHV
eukprot:UN24243